MYLYARSEAALTQHADAQIDDADVGPIHPLTDKAVGGNGSETETSGIEPTTSDVPPISEALSARNGQPC